jgi:hypothetical protein
MEIIIKYRNDRKAEGASQAELNGLDGRINFHLSSSPLNEAKTLDIELLNYRRSIAESADFTIGGAAINKAEFLTRLDKHIFHLLGSKPARLVDIQVRSIASEKSRSVAVDLCNETVYDLLQKACVVLGIHGPAGARLIVRGTHYDIMDMSLEDAGIRETDTVVVCKRLGCDGRCCSVNYGMLCDAFLRDTHAVFKDINEDERHKIFVSMSKLKEMCYEKKVLPCEPVFDKSAKSYSALASLLREAEPVCWALPSLKRQGDITATDANPHFKSWTQRNDIISCSAVSEPPQDKAAAVAALISNLSEKSKCASAAPVIDDEELYG